MEQKSAAIIRGYSLGAVDYIIKPFNADALLAKVRMSLDQQGLQRNVALSAQEAARLRSTHRGA
jgi:DNA-binding response OmpR family regulator